MTNREKALAILLPAIVTAGAYSYFVLVPKVKGVTEARKQLDSLRAKPATTGSVAEERAKLAAVAKEIEDDRQKIENLKRQWNAAVSTTSTPLCRPERIERLNQLLDRAGLRIIDGADLEPGKGPHAHGMDALAADIGDRCGNPAPRTRVVRFQGRYTEVAAALAAISRGEVLAVPVGLTMKSLDDSGLREWTLHVWV